MPMVISTVMQYTLRVSCVATAIAVDRRFSLATRGVLSTVAFQLTIAGR